jgi:hypothetical protein
MDSPKTDRRPYATPKFTVYGDIVALTHGPKGGGGHNNGGHNNGGHNNGGGGGGGRGGKLRS